MQENVVDMGNVVLVLGRGRQALPGRVGAEYFPMIIAGGHIVKAGHIHQVGHMGAGED